MFRSLDSMKENLHAYWRDDYVDAKKSGDEDPFELMKNSEDDDENLVLFRGKHSFAVMNKYPYNAGHVLVLPYRAVADLEQLGQEERIDFFENIVKIKSALQNALLPDGFNIGMNIGSAAGAGIPKHLHCHIVPRWNGDTNFMPVIGNTKVLSKSQKTMLEKLRPLM